MAFSELELKRWERDLDAFLARRRPPPSIRNELDVGYRIDKQSIEIVEICPDWHDPGTMHERPFARITYVRSGSYWKLYWMRASLKWHSYEPQATTRHLSEALDAIDRDDYCCFFG